MELTLFEMYINEVSSINEETLNILELQANGDFFYTLLFVDDQVLITLDREDSE